jgi:photosynthetic reaction center cytochrome c subunit
MKKWRVIIGLIGVMYVGIAATMYRPTPDEGFKNLQVLPKDITEKKLDSIMKEYSVSLGVRCGFCHARNADTTNRHLDFASDAKDEKKAARHMMKMTADINTNYFNWMNSTRPDTIHAVICYTCHRGSNEVDSKNFLNEIAKTLAEKKKGK